MAEMLTISLLLGLISGFLAGLFGIGGGLVIVPGLAIVFQHYQFPEHTLMIMAIATSLATINLTALASIRAHHRLGSMLWGRVLHLLPGIVLGAGFGAWLAHNLDDRWLRISFIVFLCHAGLKLLKHAETPPVTGKPTWWVDWLAAWLIGTLSAIIGIGGGTMTVPYLVRCGHSILNAIAVSSACGLPIAMVATLSYSILGWRLTELPPYSFGYIYLPACAGISLASLMTAPLGAKLAHKLPAKRLKRYFALLLFAIAAKMAFP